MSKAKLGYAASELFSYSEIVPIKVIDLQHRLKRAGAPEESKARLAWAKGVLEGDTPLVAPDQLAFDYAAHLDEWNGLHDGLPGRMALRNPDGFEAAVVSRDDNYLADVQRVELQFLAMALDPAITKEKRQTAAQLLQFVERFPELGKAPAKGYFAPVLARRREIATAPPKVEPIAAPEDAETTLLNELNEIVQSIDSISRIRNDHIARLQDRYQTLRRDRGAALRHVQAKKDATEAPRKHQKVKSKKPAFSPPEQSLRADRREIIATIEGARRAWQDAQSAETSIRGMSSLINDQAMDARPRPSSDAAAEPRDDAADFEVATVIARLDELAQKHKLPERGYCQILTEVLRRIDQIDRPDPNLSSNVALAEHLSDAPKVQFNDSVRMLGKAELVRVEEEFVSYSAAEISYIQTAMPGERRLRRTSSEHMQETVLEQLDDATSERGEESSATTKSALRSEIESELQSRLDSNVSVSGSGQGGGSVGVVNFSGGGSASADLGLGVDTGIRSSNQTEFSQEILRKAVERTTQRTMERRVTRSVNSYSKSDEYEITNESDSSINGTYVFLNKHIAVTETVYGVRAFLEAKVLLPGRSMVAAKQSLHRAVIEDLGERPRFDISPDQITPANYMRLAGQFRASNVEPPPPPVSRLTRVFKTDSASATGGSDSFKGGKIADVLVPFFGKYQRFAITDNVDVPEGYGVLDVDVAVSHGANGVSVPAHLPLTLPGTALYAASSFVPFAMGLLGVAFLPAWVWSVAQAASPILHYNTDSSNVTVTIGTEGQDSAYYFFEPDDLLDIITGLLQAISAASPQLISGIRSLADQRLAEVRLAAAQVPAEISSQVGKAVEGALTRIKKILEKLAQADLPGAAADVIAIDDFSLSLELTEELKDVFEPFTDFIDDLSGLLQDEVGDAIQQVLSEVLSRMENNQRMEFNMSRGAEGKLPIAVNALALNPGVTVTVSACLLRTQEGLARWQLRTFEAFYQSYMQQLAAWESQFYSDAPKGLTRSPGLMRRDERVAIKERVIAALDGLYPNSSGTIDIERLELFEHAIDWESVSFRLFNYGPSPDGMELEHSGLLSDADEDRRRFLLASWAQVMIPLQAHDGLTAQFLDFMDGGTGRVADAVSDDPTEVIETDELTALYRDLVLSRSLIGENPPPGEPRFVTLPTDLVALFEANLADNLPRNPNWP